MGMKYLLRPLAECEITEAAELAAAAFMTSPGYAYIFEGLDEKQRQAGLKWLFERNIALQLPSARCAFANEAKKKEMVCFFMMQQPHCQIAVWAMLTNGILAMPFLFGLQPFLRLLEVKNHHDVLDKAHGGTALVHLERMVVKPGWQGKGVGSQCLRQGLQECTDREQGVMLTTQEEKNVNFYSRLGFKEVHRDEDHPFKPTSSTALVYNVIMIYPYEASS